MGLKNERLLQQLLTKDHKKPLEELFQLALTFKAAEKESLKRSDTSQPASLAAIDGPTIAVTRNGKSLKQRSGSQGRRKSPCQTSGTNNLTNNNHSCASCGGNHVRSTCKFRNVKCHNCGKLGHIQKVCRATAGVVHSNTQSPDSAVVPLSTAKQEDHIPPMFQML